jgi:hypothetical protein
MSMSSSTYIDCISWVLNAKNFLQLIYTDFGNYAYFERKKKSHLNLLLGTH